MKNIRIQVSDNISEVEVLAERIGVLCNDLDQGYFDQVVNGPEDSWKIGGYFYEAGRIKMEMVVIMLRDMKEQLAKTQELLNRDKNIPWYLLKDDVPTPESCNSFKKKKEA